MKTQIYSFDDMFYESFLVQACNNAAVCLLFRGMVKEVSL